MEEIEKNLEGKAFKKNDYCANPSFFFKLKVILMPIMCLQIFIDKKIYLLSAGFRINSVY